MGNVILFIHLILITYLKYNQKWGVINRYKSFWVGLHYSDYNKRFCLNIIPGLTIWWVKSGGK